MENIFIMMVGLPGSGKTTYANKYAEEIDALVISSDDVREQIFGDVNDQGHNSELFDIIHNMIIESLRCKQNVIFDATNIVMKHRIALLKKIKEIKCVKKCYIMATPMEDCYINNNSRERKVPNEVIENMYKRWQTPAEFEGWDEIKLIYAKESYKTEYGEPKDLVVKVVGYDQKNKHHNKSLGDHLVDTAHRVRVMRPEDEDLVFAALIHDLGKPFTQSFKDGDPNAHYYSHQNVGAYDCLFMKYPRYIDKLDVSLLVNLHMDPYSWGSEEIMEKKKKLFGEHFFSRLMVLHGADQYEH